MEDFRNEIINLIKELNYHTKLYDEGVPIWSDNEWDKHYYRLMRLEDLSGIYMPDSPTQKVNYQVVSELKKVKHNHPMLSLQKTKEIEDIKKFIGNKEYVAMAKMDGLTCSLKYSNGKLVSAETRGNGEIGEDILHNALVIKSIPKFIKWDEDLIVDGEIICTKSNFKRFSQDYKNPRNFAAGSIRLLDSEECAKRHLTFVAWDIIDTNGGSLMDKFYGLDCLGFEVVPYCSNSDLNKDIEKIKDLSDDYPIDGIVFKYDDQDYYQSLGHTEHHYRGGIAYKFYDESEETMLEDIEWTLGRTGVLTPVAVFSSIDIDGSVINRASLHNLTILEKTLHTSNGLCGWKGQRINVFKANMIIPQISDAEYDNNESKEYFLIPEVCPVCGGKADIEVSDSGIMNMVCKNPNCEGKLINKLDHYCGKKGFEIKGLSKATLGKLIDWGWVNEYKDLYLLTKKRTEWMQKPGFGEKSVDNILSAIDNSRKCTLDRVIAAFGIPLIGSTISKDLIKRFSTYEDFRNAIKNNFDFTTFDGYGDEMNKALRSFDYSAMDDIVNNFLHINEIELSPVEESNDSLSGLNIVITGKLAMFKNRDEFKTKIEAYGGKVVNSVSKNTNYLVNNDIESNSSKNLNAKKLGIEILTEENFVKKFFGNS